MSSSSFSETKFSQFIRNGGEGAFTLPLLKRNSEIFSKQDSVKRLLAREKLRELFQIEAQEVEKRIRSALGNDGRLSKFKFNAQQKIQTHIDALLSASAFSNTLEANIDDLVRRFSADLNREWQIKIGINLYIWRTQEDDRVRSLHGSRNLSIFSWETEPNGGHPGEDYNCRCWAAPYEHDYRSFFWNSILGHEGGWSDHPNDRGGATNFGITIATWRIYSQRLFGIDATEQSLRNITQEQAFKIFEIGFWRASRADRIVDPSLAYMYADFVFNSGPKNAGRALQRSLRKLGQNIHVDGIVGSQTIKAVNALDAAKLYRALRTARWDYLEDLMENDPSQEKFRNGWRRRVFSFQDY